MYLLISCNWEMCLYMRLIFTFHNVSINSIVDVLIQNKEEHLHSIMYLLILMT